MSILTRINRLYHTSTCCWPQSGTLKLIDRLSWHSESVLGVLELADRAFKKYARVRPRTLLKYGIAGPEVLVLCLQIIKLGFLHLPTNHPPFEPFLWIKRHDPKNLSGKRHLDSIRVCGTNLVSSTIRHLRWTRGAWGVLLSNSLFLDSLSNQNGCAA